jgi:hypothetical protein
VVLEVVEEERLHERCLGAGGARPEVSRKRPSGLQPMVVPAKRSSSRARSLNSAVAAWYQSKSRSQSAHQEDASPMCDPVGDQESGVGE